MFVPPAGYCWMGTLSNQTKRSPMHAIYSRPLEHHTLAATRDLGLKTHQDRCGQSYGTQRPPQGLPRASIPSFCPLCRCRSRRYH
jgi:hypothetical protein